MNRIILTMKWGQAFSSDYVNVLYSAVSHNVRSPFTFVCFTDDSSGLRKEIEVLPLPEFGLSSDEWYTSAVWPKLGLFNQELSGLSGRALFLDLDTLVLGPIDKFFDLQGAIILQDMGAGWRNPPRRGPPEPGTCIFAYTIGEQSQIPNAFMADKLKNKNSFKNEQDFVAKHANDLHLWPDGWVSSFKRHVSRRNGLDILLTPSRPNCSIVAFHGRPRPAELIGWGVWGNFPHFGRGPVGWIKDYWEFHKKVDS